MTIGGIYRHFLKKSLLFGVQSVFNLPVQSGLDLFPLLGQSISLNSIFQLHIIIYPEILLLLLEQYRNQLMQPTVREWVWVQWTIWTWKQSHFSENGRGKSVERQKLENRGTTCMGTGNRGAETRNPSMYVVGSRNGSYEPSLGLFNQVIRRGGGGDY